MDNKQTRCPQCTTVYQVTALHLSVAQGMVCCPKCNINFNAIAHLQPTSIHHLSPSPQHDFSSITIKNLTTTQHAYLLTIFDQRIDHSNINLLTYLNNLNYFNIEPITTFPNLNLSEHHIPIDTNSKSIAKSWLYYLFLAMVSLILLLLIALLIVWLSPRLLLDHPLLHQITHLFKSNFS